MTFYLDTSVLLRHLLGQADVLDWTKWEAPCSSEITSVEARRVIDRFRLELALDDEGVAEAQEELRRIERHLGILPLSRSVLLRARLPMPTVVKTLDAIHLTSALMLQESKGVTVTFATHDRRQAIAARAFGFTVLGV